MADVQVDAAGYKADVEFMAKSRPPGSEHWKATQERCAEVLTTAGFEVERQAYGSGVNVLGRRVGTSSPNEVVLIGAHYDSLPECPGADDNASGVAGVLAAARTLAGRSYDRTLLLACWDEEETGFIGSRAFVRSLTTSQRIVAHYNFEMIAFVNRSANAQNVPSGFDLLFPNQVSALRANDLRGDFIAVVTDPISATAANRFAVHAEHLGLPCQVLEVPDALKNSELLSDLRRSDHSPFWSAELPGIMITDTADFRNPNYHCIKGTDTVETLDFDFAVRVVRTTIAAAEDMLKR